MWLESEVKRGSSFYFTIECYTHENGQFRDELVDTNCFKNKKILIVDDNNVNRISLCSILLKWGALPSACSSIDEAMVYIRNKYEFDLGLLDIRMPKMSGIKLARRIRKAGLNYPLVAISSLGHCKTVDPFYMVLIKPIKESKLYDVCRGAMNKTELQLKEKELYATNSIPILVVEDVYINQMVITNYLKKLGYNNLSIAEHGEAALQLVTKTKFDIIFMDIKMPVMGGVECFNKICEMDIIARPYVIALTADVSPDAQRYYLNECGMHDYLGKPITSHDIKHVLQRYNERR